MVLSTNLTPNGRRKKIKKFFKKVLTNTAKYGIIIVPKGKGNKKK